MTEDEKRAYHHVFDEPDSDHVVLTWPRTIPMREGDRGWSDMQMIQRRLPELADVPTLLLWAPEDNVLHDRVCEPAQGTAAARRRARTIRSGRAFSAGRSRPGPGGCDHAVPQAHAGGKSMKFITPTVEELSYLRADPLLWEQELDVRPRVAESIERAVASGQAESTGAPLHDHLYALELADLGRGRPSMAMVYGMWDRYEPRPPEHEIDADLIDFSLWVAEISEGLDPAHLSRVLRHDRHEPRGRRVRCSALPPSASAICRISAMSLSFVEVEGLRMAYVEAGDGRARF